MADAKRKPGRPRKEGDERSTFHLGFKFTETTRQQLQEIVDRANEKAIASGLPGNQTIYSIVRYWILERVRAESPSELIETDNSKKRPRKLEKRELVGALVKAFKAGDMLVKKVKPVGGLTCYSSLFLDEEGLFSGEAPRELENHPRFKGERGKYLYLQSDLDKK